MSDRMRFSWKKDIWGMSETILAIAMISSRTNKCNHQSDMGYLNANHLWFVKLFNSWRDFCCFFFVFVFIIIYSFIIWAFLLTLKLSHDTAFFCNHFQRVVRRRCRFLFYCTKPKAKQKTHKELVLFPISSTFLFCL